MPLKVENKHAVRIYPTHSVKVRRLARDSHRTAETDLQFIQRILAEDGIWFRTGVNTTTGLDTVTFADSQLQYQFDVRLPYRESSALHDGAVEAVWDARVWHHTVTGSVATRDYNYRTAGTPMDAKVSVRSEAATTGEHYCYAAPYREAGDDITSEQETESGAFYTRIRHEHVLNNAIRLHLFSNASHLTPGMVLETGDSGVPELKEGMVIRSPPSVRPVTPACTFPCVACPTASSFASGQHRYHACLSRVC